MGFFVKFLFMQLFIIPLMSALLAWFIAWLWVKLLFSSNGKYLQKEIEAINIDSLFNQDTSRTQFEAVLPTIDAQLDHFFTHKIGEKLPMISMFIGEKTIVQLKAVFIEELSSIFPTLVKSLSTSALQAFSKDLHSKWSPILEARVLKSTLIIRIISFFIGLIWGFIINFLLYQI
jgi:hypothetical protein